MLRKHQKDICLLKFCALLANLHLQDAPQGRSACICVCFACFERHWTRKRNLEGTICTISWPCLANQIKKSVNPLCSELEAIKCTEIYSRSGAVSHQLYCGSSGGSFLRTVDLPKLRMHYRQSFTVIGQLWSCLLWWKKLQRRIFIDISGTFLFQFLDFVDSAAANTYLRLLEGGICGRMRGSKKLWRHSVSTDPLRLTISVIMEYKVLS